MDRILSKFSGDWSPITKRFKWATISKDELLEFVEELERHKSQISLDLNAVSLYVHP
ncbi:hypothetical protein AcW1_004055 [Taiwanofungus camphoratus]|nr:hypothetical protein AcW1_004055 [Antrodia cinnamomea]